MDHIVPLFLMHEANTVIIYSQQLSKQIPPSHEAHAFNQFQHSMHLFEIIRLCAIWDEPGDDRESIPTIIALFNERGLIDELINETSAFHSNESLPTDSSYQGDNAKEMAVGKAWLNNPSDEAAQHIAQQIETARRRKLSFATDKAKEIQESPQLKALRDFRDCYIAHNLDVPHPAMDGETTVEILKYGDETELLENTVVVADALHCGLNQTGFDWEGSQKIARRNARGLWEGCTFQIQQA